jgi:hypothetical protein
MHICNVLHPVLMYVCNVLQLLFPSDHAIVAARLTLTS